MQIDSIEDMNSGKNIDGRGTYMVNIFLYLRLTKFFVVCGKDEILIHIREVTNMSCKNQECYRFLLFS